MRADPIATSLSLAAGALVIACHVTTGPAPTSQPAVASAAPAPAPATTDTAAVASASAAPSASTAPATPAPLADSDASELPDATSTPEQSTFGNATGRSKTYTPGADEGLWIWKDAKGDGWHLRSTTGHKKHRFQGRIEADGPLIGLHATGNEGTDKLHTTPKGVWFSFSTQGHEDGFDFKLPAGSCMRVLSAIDGKPRPDRVYLGSGDAHPTNAHIKLCP
ncbi:MAG: hypothetical protein JWM74_1252 [Myxococcaceae bacterium]|jgi:hypothetical protein|nr:hypothetical protein [Myxococcaceae bacterium]